MDTSKKYIKMCQEAKKIQDIYQAKLLLPKQEGRDILKGWVVACTKGVEQPYAFLIQFHVIDDVVNYPANLIDKTWLPHQDQLQKMVEPSGLSDHLLYCFWDFLTYDNGEYALNSYARSFYSFEQLWLAFVMRNKYEKIWDKKEENWVCHQ